MTDVLSKMKKLDRIKTKIQNLNTSELSDLRNWFLEYDSDIWDKEIEENIKGGRLDFIAEKAILSYKKNEFKEF